MKGTKIIKKFNYQQVIVFLDILSQSQANVLEQKQNSQLFSKTMRDYWNERAYTVKHSMVTPQKTSLLNLFSRKKDIEESEIHQKLINNSIPSSDPNFLFKQKKPYVPNQFFENILSTPQKQNLYIWESDMQRWILKDSKFLEQIKSLNKYQDEVSNCVISRCLDFGTAKRLIEVLQKIPNFKIKISEEQKNVISSSGDVVCIGRSGTGKTTCAVLRMFAMEILFKYRMAVYNSKNKYSFAKIQLNQSDIEKNMGIRCLFVTASPVLTNEIKRYYERLTKELKEQLILRDQRKEAEQLEKLIIQSKASQDEEEQINSEEVDIDDQQVEKMIEEQIGGILLQKQVNQNKRSEEEEEYQKEELRMEEEEEEDLQRDMDKFESLASMQPSDFPSFMTIRNLIMLVDASLTYPFFYRNQQGKIQGQTTQNTWHNEQTGTLYINKNFKSKRDDGEDEKNKGMPDLDTAIDNEDLESNQSSDENDGEEEGQEENLNTKYKKVVQSQDQKIQSITASKVKIVTKKKKLAYEVDFNYFKRFFWKRVQNKVIGFKQMEPETVWTEIYSNIKGSTKSLHYQNFSSYQSNSKRQNRFSKEEINKLFEIYHEYENWKNEQGCYDFMDLVNYIIRSLESGINKKVVDLHYIMIDEVQDLPMNILYLIKKITSHGNFYSGDTAQTIAQGVGFRYGDLKTLFQSDQHKITKTEVAIQQLTVNFRSHNKILYMANSVIDLLQNFFPETIDKLKKEKSSIDGPKPIILGQGDPEMLHCLLSGDKSYKNSKNDGDLGRSSLEFGCNQVILVRNQESKKKLPGMLQHALCLTIYEAKGLEFDDVLLFNFFEDSQMDQQKWNLLRHLKFQTSFSKIGEYSHELEEEENLRILKLEKIHELRQTIIQNEQQDNIFRKSIKRIKDFTKKEYMTKQLYQKTLEREAKLQELKDLESTISSNAAYEIEIKGSDMIKVVQLGLNPIAMRDSQYQGKDYSSLCIELKQLYVAITRPRNRLIIYDQDPSCRKQIQEYWDTLGCVEVITQEMLEGKAEQQDVEESGVNIKVALARKSDSHEWLKQGMKMMKLKYFEQAMLCFQKAGENKYTFQAKVFYLAQTAKDELEEAQREQIFIDQGIAEYALLSKNQKTTMQAEISSKIREARRKFREVGDNFASCGSVKQAAKCYFSALAYDKAALMYLEIQNFKSAAECYFILKEYEKAADIYQKIGEYTKAIECLDIIEQYGKILEVIYSMKEKMTLKQSDMYFKRYAPLALEQLAKDAGLAQIELKQRKEITEKPKIMELIQKDQILEEEEEEQEQEEEEDDNQQASNNGEGNLNEILKENKIESKLEEKEVEGENDIEIDSSKNKSEDSIANMEFEESVEVIKTKEQAPSYPKKEDDSSVSIMEMDFSSNESQLLSHPSNNNKNNGDSVSFINEQIQNNQSVSIVQLQSSQNVNKNNNHDETSFIEGSFEQGVLDMSNISFDVLRSKNLLNDFDHLSNFDPEDQWLRVEEGSVIEIINKSRQSGIFSCSDFSAVDACEVGSINVQMIKTSADIFIQDEIMQQIIHYMSMFSESFKSELEKRNSSEAFLSSRIEKNDESLNENAANNFLIDLDNIDMKFLYLILDSLEYYNIFRLAIFVCNRYKLSKKAGRYLVSLAHKFSPCPKENNSLNWKLIRNTPERQRRIEQSMIANIAIHNLFEVINPEFLRLKEAGESVGDHNSLGIEVFRSFIMLGYWKKILYLMDYERSLSLSSYFSDFNSYKNIFITKNSAYKNKVRCIEALRTLEPNFECLPFDIPRNQQEEEFVIICLEHIIFDFNQKLALINKQSQVKVLDFHDPILAIPSFPSFFSYNEQLWKYISKKQTNKFIKNAEEDLAFIKIVGECCSIGVEILKLKRTEKLPKDLSSPKIFDIFSFYSNLLNQLQLQEKLQSVLISYRELESFLAFSQIGIKILKIFTNFQQITDFDFLILRALLSPLEVRLNTKTSDLLRVVGNQRICVHKSIKLVESFQISIKGSVSSTIKLEEFHITPKSFEEFSSTLLGKGISNYYFHPFYKDYCEKINNYMSQIKNLIEQEDKSVFDFMKSIPEFENKLDRIKELQQDVEFIEQSQRNKFFFLDMDCDFISAPLEEVLNYFKNKVYYLIISLLHNLIQSQIKPLSTKNQTLENIFKLSAFNLTYAELMEKADELMNKKEGSMMLNLSKENIIPDYKKLKRTNPMYKIYKLDYIEEIEKETQDELEYDDDIKKFFKSEGIKKKKRRIINLSLNEKIRQELLNAMRSSFKGIWNTSVPLQVKNVLIKFAFEIISSHQIESSYDLKIILKAASILNIFGMQSYLLDFEFLPSIRKYANMQIESVFQARSGEILTHINTTLDICDKFFLDMGTTDKFSRLEYCLLWSMIGFKASRNAKFTIHLSQSFLKMLPPLNFQKFTTNLKDQNQLNVPSKFMTSIDITPIQNIDIITDILIFITDIFQKQMGLIKSPKKVIHRMVSLILLVLYNLAEYINEELASEIYNNFELLNSSQKLQNEIKDTDLWDDLMSTKDAQDLQELLPLFINDHKLNFDQDLAHTDIIQEIEIENIRKTQISNKKDSKKETKKLNKKDSLSLAQVSLLQAEKQCAIRRESSVVFKRDLIYNLTEIRKKQMKLKRVSQILEISRLERKQEYQIDKCINTCLKNNSIFGFFSLCDNFFNYVLTTIISNFINDPLDFHFLMMQLQQAEAKYHEYLRLLSQILQGDAYDQHLNVTVKKLEIDMTQKTKDLMNWSNQQKLKENEEDYKMIFWQNKMSIAIKWAKIGQYSDAKKLVANIEDDLKMKEANSLKVNLENSKPLGNRLFTKQKK